MKPEKASIRIKEIELKLRKATKVFDSKIDLIYRRTSSLLNALDAKSSAVQSEAWQRIEKIRASCRHKFENIIGNPPELYCLCGTKKQ
jgi:hypothetical protein